MRSPQPLTNICGYSTRTHAVFCTFYSKNIPIFIAKIPSKCNRKLDFGHLVNPSGLFSDDKHASNNKYNGPSSFGHNEDCTLCKKL